MAIIKLTKKKDGVEPKGILIFTDEGMAYSTSRAALKLMCEGTWKGEFIELTKLPIAVDTTRFRKSKVYDPTGTLAKSTEGKSGREWDGLGKARLKQQEDVQQYSDKSIW